MPLDTITWLTPLGRSHLIVFAVIVPALAIFSYFKVRKAPKSLPDRMRHFRGTTVTLLLFGGFSLFVGHQQQVDLFPLAFFPTLRAAPAGLLMYLAMVLYMRPRWRKAVEARKPIVQLFMPSNATERAWWIVVAVLAGLSEEITWRGVQTMLLAFALGSVPAAAVVCALLFGVAHAVQGPRLMAIVCGFALGFQALVALSGALYLAMAVHIAYDVTAGLTYGRLGRKLAGATEGATAP
jgi:membrane protease YdiL (CAAX protease family)